MTESRSERIPSVAEAVRYLDGLVDRERSSQYAYARLDLRPIEALLDALGRPHDRLSIVHVAGSKGKGSTCLFTETLLGALGERVGTFTSPHLVRWSERFRIAGREVSDAALVAAVERARPAVDRLKAGPPETRPSFFDATTAIAFLLFAEAGVDRAVVEVGLGGRLDSTNAVAPAVTCITSIELEHTDKLGKTEAAIAGEKAGILKRGIPAVLGRLGQDADRVIRGRAAELAAPVFALGEHFEVAAEATKTADPETPALALGPARRQVIRFDSPGWQPIRASLAQPGEAVVTNAGLALACVRALGVHGESALRDAAQALAQAELPGRIEILENDPAVLVDAAHTERSALVLARTLDSLAPSGYELLLSISADKNVEAVLAPLLPRAARVWVTRSDVQRSLPPEKLAERVREMRPDVPVDVVADPVEAARRARAALGAGRLLCAVGSVYLAGAVRRVLGPDTRAQ